jgi:hypothetical protein
MGGQTGTIELTNMGSAMAGPPAQPKDEPKAATEAPKAATGADPLSGNWDCSADIQGSAMPFTMSLKLEGDQVTGSTDAGQGATPITKGTWAADKLSFSIDTPQGTIVMTGMVKDGKIAGEYDFAGQMKGKWEGKKK